VDALMRELRFTGYMANRGRHIVASYLIHFLGIDWRVGADWFERCLLDHDVCSNYGEWASMAGVAAAPSKGQPLGLKGRGPSAGRSAGKQGSAGNPWAKGVSTGDAVFDPWEQAKQYDRTEAYVRCWVPELRHLPSGQAHWPPSCSGYPQPLAEHAFQYPEAAKRVRTDREAASPKTDSVSSGSGYPLVGADAVASGRRWRAKNTPGQPGGSGRRWNNVAGA